MNLKQGLVHAGFIGLVAFTWYEGHLAPAALEAGSSSAAGGMRFREVAREVGIDFVHGPTNVDPAVGNIATQITAVGAAVSVCDADGDGHPDLYATSSADGAANALYRNRGDGTFEDVAARAGLAELNVPGQLACMGSVWADYDGDGDQDVFVYGWGFCRLLRNEGGMRFEDATEESGYSGRMNSNAATWFDYDRDGWLDLYVAGYFAEEHDLRDLATTRIMQDSFEFSHNGGRNRLFRGLGDGRFEEVTSSVGLEGTRWTYAAVAADFDRDGWPDIYLANDYGPEELFLNRGGERFELAAGIGLEGESKSGMCVALGDVWNRGRLSVFVTNISQRGYLFQGNNLRVSMLDAGGPMLQLAEGQTADCGWAWGAQFGDLDDDGFQDLVVANGFVSASRERDYWYQMSKISLATGEVVEDAALWPSFEDRSLSGYQRTRVLRSTATGRGRFIEVGREVGIDDEYDGRAVAIADLDDDGRLDVVIANQGGPLLVYRNESEGAGHWISFDLRGAGGNPDAIGAEVELEYGEHRQLQVLTAACGFASQNGKRVHFGLGSEPGPVRAVVRWPSGALTALEDPELDRVHLVEEGPQ